jgi:hypothetical protein
MRLTVVFCFALSGAHSVAGMNPVAFSIQTEAFGRVGPQTAPLVVQTDLDIAPSFFSSIESDALARVGFDTGTGRAGIAVTGDASNWTIAAFARGFGDSYDHSTQGWGESRFSVTFFASAGYRVVVDGLYAAEGYSDEGGWTNTFSLALREGNSVLQLIEFNRSGHPYESEDPISFETLLTSTGEYTLEMISRGGGGASPGPGVGYSSGRSTTNLSIAIVPAPLTAAPLTMGGLLALRRRRRA